MGNTRFEMDPNFEKNVQKMLVKNVQEAIDEVFAAHANAPEDTVRPALGKALRKRGIEPEKGMLDQIAPSISAGEKPTAR